MRNNHRSGYSERNLAYARKAYVLYPDYNILQTRLQNLSWSHLCLLTGVEEDAAREWYFQAAQDESWGVRLNGRKRFIKCNTTTPNINE